MCRIAFVCRSFILRNKFAIFHNWNIFDTFVLELKFIFVLVSWNNDHFIRTLSVSIECYMCFTRRHFYWILKSPFGCWFTVFEVDLQHCYPNLKSEQIRSNRSLNKTKFINGERMNANFQEKISKFHLKSKKKCIEIAYLMFNAHKIRGPKFVRLSREQKSFWKLWKFIYFSLLICKQRLQTIYFSLYFDNREKIHRERSKTRNKQPNRKSIFYSFYSLGAFFIQREYMYKRKES